MARREGRSGRRVTSALPRVAGAALVVGIVGALVAGCAPALPTDVEGGWGNGPDHSITVRPDGVAIVEAIGVVGVGSECVATQVHEVSGQFEWEWIDKYSLVIRIDDARDLVIYSDAMFGVSDWSEVSVAPCGPDTPPELVTYMFGGLE